MSHTFSGTRLLELECGVCSEGHFSQATRWIPDHAPHGVTLTEDLTLAIPELLQTEQESPADAEQDPEPYLNLQSGVSRTECQMI